MSTVEAILYFRYAVAILTDGAYGGHMTNIRHFKSKENLGTLYECLVGVLGCHKVKASHFAAKGSQ